MHKRAKGPNKAPMYSTIGINVRFFINVSHVMMRVFV
jgi:hypothetical protein